MIFLCRDYENFCKNLADRGVFSKTAAEVLETKPKKFLILKHDVETNPKKALEISKIENRFNHKASYYVHFDILINHLYIFRQIQDLGHEVSYHYDVLDRNRGDFKKAKKEFDKHLEILKEKGFEIKSVCQHGNPLIKRIGYSSNRDFFRKFGNEYKIKDIVVNFKETTCDFIYVSDVGYKWQIVPNPETSDIKEVKTIPIEYKDIIELAEKYSLIVSSHPHRYFKNIFEARIKLLVFNEIKKIAKFAYKLPLGKKIINKFYFLARKF